MTTKPIRVDLEVELHKALKIYVASKNMTIADWLRIKIKEDLKEK